VFHDVVSLAASRPFAVDAGPWANVENDDVSGRFCENDAGGAKGHALGVIAAQFNHIKAGSIFRIGQNIFNKRLAGCAVKAGAVA